MPCPEEPLEDAAEDIKAAWKAEYKIQSECGLFNLGRMSPALQRQFELYFPQAMLDELRRMFEKPKAVEIYDLVDTLHSCKQAPGKSVSAHVLEMKGYMDQLQALGKPYDNDMAINLINRNTVSDLHALLIDYEKGLKDKAPTPQVLAIQKGRVNKPKPQANKKGKSKGKADKNKQVVAYQPKPKQNPPQKKENPKKDHMTSLQRSWSLEEELPSLPRRTCHIVKTPPPTSSHNPCKKLQREGILESINDESYDKCESCISGKMTKKPFNNNIERATDLLGLIHTDVCGPLRHVGPGAKAYVKRDSADKLQQRSVKCIFVGYPKETMGYYFYFLPENKVIVARYGDFLKRDLISQEFSGRDYELEDDHMDTLPSKNTSEIPVERKLVPHRNNSCP
ncbi:hypothetical protein Tco_1079463 [Tanacetum coccineum]|uniref:Retroviral polymerase SH3-like domain-containing protein n=1 Tax=Tanacetum coccineum TaxID=301880 RepID=A0ABQ5HRV4_9ASTR